MSDFSSCGCLHMMMWHDWLQSGERGRGLEDGVESRGRGMLGGCLTAQVLLDEAGQEAADRESNDQEDTGRQAAPLVHHERAGERERHSADLHMGFQEIQEEKERMRSRSREEKREQCHVQSRARQSALKDGGRTRGASTVIKEKERERDPPSFARTETDNKGDTQSSLRERESERANGEPGALG